MLHRVGRTIGAGAILAATLALIPLLPTAPSNITLDTPPLILLLGSAGVFLASLGDLVYLWWRRATQSTKVSRRQP